jgi:hypothetical protein
MLLYKVIFSSWSSYPWYMPSLHSDPPVGGSFTGAVGGDGVVAGVTAVFSLCRFYQVPASFYKALVRSYFITAG